MNIRYRQKGFSLTEVLMAAGILAIGFIFIAGTFPVGVKLAALTTERSIGTVAAEEAAAKIRLYGVDVDDPNKLQTNSQRLFGTAVLPAGVVITAGEFLYPSADISPQPYRYNWSALCRRRIAADANDVQVTIFVSRKGSGARYPDPANPAGLTVEWPQPIKITRFNDPSDPADTNRIEIAPANVALARYIAEGAILADDKTGQLMRVVERRAFDGDDVADPYRRVLVLAEKVDENLLGDYFWVIPTAVGSGTNPCVSVLQRNF